jgi:hypothetical protein
MAKGDSAKSAAEVFLGAKSRFPLQVLGENRRVRNSGQGAPPSLLPAGAHWRFSLRAFRCNRGRGRIGRL